MLNNSNKTEKNDENPSKIVELKDIDQKSGTTTREEWGGKLEFIFSCLSYAVGLGNLWRFPYRCYSNGGGAFLIPYTVILLLAGMPLVFLEMSFGQYASEGIISIWKICPLMEGIGWGMFFVSFLVGIYYNMIVAWTIYYLFASLGRDVPWRGCGNEWNTGRCSSLDDIDNQKNCTNKKGFWFNRTCFNGVNGNITLYNEDMRAAYNLYSSSNFTDTSYLNLPSYEYFHRYALDISDGIGNLDTIKWKQFGCLLLSWVLVGTSLMKGVRSQGKVAYFTALFPYFVILMMGIRVATLEGSIKGVEFYIKPDFSTLKGAKVWGDAAVQIFFSLSPCWGGLITLASYNKFNNNCYKDAIIISIGNCLTSFIAGFVVFGSIGYMANEMGTDVSKVAVHGSGLAFIAYPEVIASIPVSSLWSIIFFTMLLTLGLGTQFSVVTTVHTTILDLYPSTLRTGRKPMYLMGFICVALFLLGLPMTTRGGMYVLQLFDDYSASFSVLFIGFFEIITISWIYGIKRFSDNISEMLGKRPNVWFKGLWLFGTPTLIVGIVFFSFYQYKGSSYEKHQFPNWANIIGLCITFFPVSFIPIIAIYKLFQTYKRSESIKAALEFLLKPNENWRPTNTKIDFKPRLIEINYTDKESTIGICQKDDIIDGRVIKCNLNHNVDVGVENLMSSLSICDVTSISSNKL